MKQKNEVWRGVFFKVIGILAISIMLYTMNCQDIMSAMEIEDRVEFYIKIRGNLMFALGIESLLICINQKTENKIENVVFCDIMFFITMSILKLLVMAY